MKRLENEAKQIEKEFRAKGERLSDVPNSLQN
jgi:hypothetical protein